MKKDEQILKTRDDKAPVHFSRNVVAVLERVEKIKHDNKPKHSHE
jgi:hypothetical protein